MPRLKSKNILLVFLIVIIIIASIILTLWLKENDQASIENSSLLLMGYGLSDSAVLFHINYSGNLLVNQINLNKVLSYNIKGIHETRSFCTNDKCYLVMATHNPGKLIILSSKGKFDFNNSKIELEEELDNRVRALDVNDVYGDGQKEIVVGTRPNGILKIYKLVDDKWEGYNLTMFNKSIHDVTIADTDGDGVNEIIATVGMTAEKKDDYNQGSQKDEIVKFEFKNNTWKKEVIQEFNAVEMNGTKMQPHARYLFVDDFDGNGIKDILTNVVAENLPDFSPVTSYGLENLQWNGTGYSNKIVEDSLKTSRDVFVFGDIDNDGKNELLTPTQSNDALLLYYFDGKWKRSVLSRHLVDDENEGITSIAVLNSSAGVYKRILYTTSGTPTSGMAYTYFYVLEHDSFTDDWKRMRLYELNVSYYFWGAFQMND